MRRLQNPAFSDKALRAQESVICGYASLLVHKLHGLCGGGGGAVVDMTAWYNFTTFGMLFACSFPLPLVTFGRDKPRTMAQLYEVHKPPSKGPALFTLTPSALKHSD